MLCFLNDSVMMLLAEQANDLARTINDNGKQIYDVAPQHVDFQRLRVRHGGELPAKSHCRASLTPKFNDRFDHDRIYCAAQPTDYVFRCKGDQFEFLYGCCTEDSSIRAAIQ